MGSFFDRIFPGGRLPKLSRAALANPYEQVVNHGGGVQGMQQTGKQVLTEANNFRKSLHPMDQAALLTAPIPIAGDVTGLAADARMYAQEPEQRNWMNYGLSGLGLLPFFPAAATIRNTVKTADKGIIGTGSEFKTPYVRNTESAEKFYGKPQKGDRFGRDYEPAGMYLTPVGNIRSDLPENMISGEVNFKNPIVLDNNSLDWKRELSEKYNGKTGKKLSEAIAKDGYDGIVTIDQLRNGDYYTSETIDLSMFHK